MKLIKINPEHYIIVDDSEIKEGDYKYHHVKGIVKAICNGAYTNEFKITHSTQPLDTIILKNRDHSQSVGHYYGDGGQLSLQEVKELIGEVDVEKKASEHFKNYWTKEDGTEMSRDEITADMMTNMLMETSAYNVGYNQALEDNKDKKYTEEDLRKAIEMAQSQYWDVENRGFSINTEGDWSFKYTEEEIIQSLQPKTEWNIEFIDGKLKLKT